MMKGALPAKASSSSKSSLGSGKWGRQTGTAKDILILQAKRRRNDGFELRRTELLHEAEGSAAPRTQRRQQDIGINDDSHDGNASGCILRGKT